MSAPAIPGEAALKQQAYQLRKATGQSLGHCYEAIAKNRGFGTYAAMRAAMKSRGTADVYQEFIPKDELRATRQPATKGTA